MEYHLMLVQKEMLKRHQTIIKVRWEPPDREFYKLNIDGAVKNTPGLGGLGGVFRDYAVHWVLSFIECIPNTNPAMAKRGCN
ncbi:hypothetical protein KY285_010910 [Solanum tuberosum]|nr:hypothetical protein KY289_011484 [Solanum tuberosum]KAH0709580.1 hypothetical protein KY284_011007 [Solanum tuberosum]KAH0735203.1 hypothetical protein KY285_010910 [Solanum tuberosum]